MIETWASAAVVGPATLLFAVALVEVVIAIGGGIASDRGWSFC
jgi:hypothetical protein